MPRDETQRRAEIAARATGGGSGRRDDTSGAKDADEPAEKPVRLSCDLSPEAFAQFSLAAARRRTNKKHLLQAVALAVTLDPDDLLDRVDRILAREAADDA